MHTDVLIETHSLVAERFGVWQNINVLDMDSAAGSTSAERIHFHITAWYDEVEDFDNAKVGRGFIHSMFARACARGTRGRLPRPSTLIQLRIIVPFRLVNYSGAPWQLSSYIPIASATFIYVGCGRAIYTPDLNKTAAGYQRRDAVTPDGFGNRVEVLVCNYGPVDRIAPRQLYELGRPGLCPPGTLHSDRYKPLCSNWNGYFESFNNQLGFNLNLDAEEFCIL
ncbi:uncharacterized protein LOC109610911 [Ooceraea biroi]|uniref:uncharacterized protein LOC109610911 n=1 Tax=Ooceraea biroi TaxID=2015173 RepID=UPI000F07728D|nr:uncharacterized protein LOC109610911 [Ooceraea biroi]